MRYVAFWSNVAIYAYFQAQIIGSQAPKTFPHPCVEERGGAAWQEQIVTNLEGGKTDVASAGPLQPHHHGIQGLGEIRIVSLGWSMITDHGGRVKQWGEPGCPGWSWEDAFNQITSEQTINAMNMV